MNLPRETLLKELFQVAVSAAKPEKVMAPYLPDIPKNFKGRIIILGSGKAAAAMALEVEKKYLKEKIGEKLEGIVVTQHGYSRPCQKIEVIEASHPIPEQDGLVAAGRILELAKSAGKDDLVLCLISGGGSSLLALPPKNILLAEKQAINQSLLFSGATIDEINCVRKHLSAIKGGRLAQAASPAKVVTFLISDVPGDDPSVIASGPTVPDPTTSRDALNVLQSYNIKVSQSIHSWLSSNESESPKPEYESPEYESPEYESFKKNELHIIATPQMSLEAAAELAREHGLRAYILSDALEGEARDVGIVLAAIAKQTALKEQQGNTGQPLWQPFVRPCVILSGGETTVSLKNKAAGKKRGGRNVEFLLSLALALKGHPGIYALAADTDGIDGSEKVAGASITPRTLSQAKEMGLDLKKELKEHNAHYCFEALKTQVITGPTFTNVNDFRAILVE